MLKKQFKGILAVIMLIICITVPVFGSTESKNGLEVTLETDKDSYSKGEDVKITVNVKNTGNKPADNITVDVSVPDGVKVAEGSVTKLTIESLDAGKASTQEIKAEAVKKTQTTEKGEDLKTEANVKTGDNAKTIILIAIICAIIALVTMAAVKNKRFRNIMNMLSMIVLLSGIFSMLAYAAALQFEVSKTIKVDGSEEKITAVVSWEAEEETQESTNETDTSETDTSGEPEPDKPQEKGVKWEMIDENTLHIYGTGDMEDYDAFGTTSSPWISYRFDIKNIVIDEGVTSIGDNAFFNCSSLSEITIPDSVTSIGALAFADCSSLSGITIPAGVTSIGNRAFSDCSSLSGITIPAGVTSIGLGTFENCSSLIEVTIPAGVTSIGDCAFDYCSSLIEITIPAGVTSIGYRTFEGCSSLSEITIPDSVTSISVLAFGGCSSLSEITIPDSVTSISAAFEGCSKLTAICGTKGSYAETYANENGYDFIEK